MKIVIIDYGAGNIKSVQFAMERLGYLASLSKNDEEIRSADKVIFPGVGEASSAMNKLKETGLDLLIPQLTQPVLGICLGMQLMCNSSEENKTKGLGIFNTNVLKFSDTLKVPQIGWNQITDLKGELFEGISDGAFMYLVHSYYVPMSSDAIASTEYGITYTSALNRDNFYGVQFHPEKSGVSGALLLNNFL
ncbi:MAG: imidazole glycerol phosphate synthase subunit HisH, partial [Bacteroidota bacterium]